MTVLPTVRRQLLEAVELRTEPAGRGRIRGLRRSRSVGACLVAAGLVAIPVVIVAGAFVLLRANRAPSTAALSHTATAPIAGGIKGERQQLIDSFGVLRRPQIAADRDPRFALSPLTNPHPGRREPGIESLLRQWGYPVLDRPLVRVVSVPAFNASVGFEPTTWQPSRSSPRRAEGLNLSMWIGNANTIPPASEIGAGPPPASVGAVLTHGLALADVAPGQASIDGVMVVPDGVAAVTLRPIRLGKPGPVLKVEAGVFGSASAAVRDNVAAFRLPLPTVTRHSSVAGTVGLGADAQVTWYDAAGRVIRRTTTSVDLFIKVMSAR